jgi:hypothetical protein
MAVDYLKNVSNMMTEAEHLRRLGFSIYVPAIDLLMGIKFGYTGYNDYFDNSQPWLKAADAVYLCAGWENSKGTKAEMETAMSHGIPVFDNPDELLKYFQDKSTVNLIDELDKELAKWDELLTTISKQIRES